MQIGLDPGFQRSGFGESLTFIGRYSGSPEPKAKLSGLIDGKVPLEYWVRLFFISIFKVKTTGFSRSAFSYDTLGGIL